MKRIGCVVAALVVAAACARNYPPPGGEQDNTPPRVISVTPALMAIVPGFDEEVRFVFDERISERGVADAVVISPSTGGFDVEKGMRDIEVRPYAGWQPNRVYRVILLAQVQDLFGNRMPVGAEAIFSTGGPIPQGAIAGLVTDRLTGRAAAGARVEARASGDTVPYVAIADSTGFYDLPFLAAGTFDILAYIDQSRNRRLDPFEQRGVSTVTLDEGDTAVVTLALLLPDSTPARLALAEALDSVRIRVTFDDALDPDAPPGGARVWLLAPDTTVSDSTEVPIVGLMHPWDAERLGVRDTARVDTLRVDSVQAAPRAPLPAREAVVVTASPLTPLGRYRVAAFDIRNVAGLAGGGGSVVFRAPAPPRPPADTTRAVPPDTTGTREP